MAHAAPSPAPEPRPPLSAARLLNRLEALSAPWQWWFALAFLAIGAMDQAFTNTRSGLDFGVFVRAARRLAGGEELYRLSDGHYAFKYLPAAAGVFLPFAFLPERAAWAAWNLVSCAGLVRAMRFAAAAARPTPGILEHVAVLLLVMPLYAHMFFLGQCDAVLMWWVVESEALAERRPIASGALLALAALLKPPLALLAVPALVRRQGRRVSAAALAGAAFLLLPALRYGLAGDLALLGSWRRLLSATTPELLCSDQNYSVFALTCAYVVRPEAGARFTAAAMALGAAAIALVAVPAWRMGRRDAALGSFLAAAGALWLAAFLSPLGWRTNLIGCVPLLYLALALARGGSSLPLRALAAAVLFAQLFVGELGKPILGPAIMLKLALHRHYAFLFAAIAGVALVGTMLERGRGHAPPA